MGERKLVNQDGDDWIVPLQDRDCMSEDEMLEMYGRNYLVPGFLALQGMSIAAGLPKEGAKTAFWLRLARRLSQGLPVFGRATTPRYVLYVTGESHAGLRDRIEALRAVEDAAPNLRMITRPIDLTSDRQFSFILECSFEYDLIVFDTLGRLMGAAGLDETSGMPRMIARIDQLRDVTGAHVVLIHHPNQRGALRGHSSLLGAADNVIEHVILPDGTRTATVTHSRDEPPGLTFRYGLRTVELPGNEDQDARTTVIAEELDGEAGDRPSPAPTSGRAERKPRGRTPHVQIAVDRLHRTIVKSGEDRPAGRAVPVETWRAGFYDALPAATPEARKKAFARAVAELTASGDIETDDGWVWQGGAQSP